jgi:hypothetical protein
MRFDQLKRREFMSLLGGAAVAWPVAARGQQPVMPVIGFLRSSSIEVAQHMVARLRQGLKEAGYIEGENVAIEFRSAEGQNDRLPAFAAELIQRRVAVIVCNGVDPPLQSCHYADSRQARQRSNLRPSGRWRVEQVTSIAPDACGVRAGKD